MSGVLHILHHSGLGDHIICNAIVRTYAEKYDRIVLNTTQSTLSNVQYMYRDLTNIDFIDLYFTAAPEYAKQNSQNNYLIIGCTAEYFKNLSTHYYPTFDYGFYAMTHVPYQDRWNKFYFQRDMGKELDVFYNKLGLKDGDEYIFIHEDPSRNRLLDRKYFPQGIRQIRSDDYRDICMFDFLYTIKKAKEIHVMDSCFLALIDNMQIRHDKLFLHNYGINKISTPTAVSLNWNILRK